jgi:hypothetical protein
MNTSEESVVPVHILQINFVIFKSTDQPRGLVIRTPDYWP